MAITFNTNLSALTSQRYLGIASDKTASSLAKLSSGSRVPTAKDDAAALAVGSKLRAEVAGLNTAANNASQAVSLLQIADGALSTIGDILVRQKALAVQSSSGQLSDTERSLLNQEFSNLRTEIDRIANVTNFNGTTLLNGGDAVAALNEAVDGSLDGYGIRLSADTAVTNSADAFRVSYDTGAAATSATLTVYNITTGEAQSVDIGAAFMAKSGAANLDTDLTAGQTLDVNFSALGVTLTLDDRFDAGGHATNQDINVAFAKDASSTLVSTGTEFGGAGVTYTRDNDGGLTNTALTTLANLAAFDANTGLLTLSVDQDTVDVTTLNAVTGLQFSVNGGALGNTAALTTDGTVASEIDVHLTGGAKLFTINVAATVNTAASGGTTNDLVINVGAGLFGVAESTTTTKSFSFKVGTGTTSNDNIGFTLSAATTAALGISSSAVDTSSNAGTAITALNSAINTVASRRADIGANQSRLDYAAASISVAIENTTAAQSGLMDVDVSAEITEFTSQQVLLQAGVSLLAQANQQPSLLLRLLQ